MHYQNGREAKNGKQVPSIVVCWDDDLKQPVVQMNPWFKNFGFAKGVLRQAIEQLEEQERMQRMVQMQQAAVMAEQDQAVARKILQGK